MDELIQRLEQQLAEFSGPTYTGSMETPYVRGVRDGLLLAISSAREMNQ